VVIVTVVVTTVVVVVIVVVGLVVIVVNYMKQIPFFQPTDSPPLKKSASFVGPGGSHPYSGGLAIGYNTGPPESSPRPCRLFIYDPL
jgi:hypothetical protein